MFCVVFVVEYNLIVTAKNKKKEIDQKQEAFEMNRDMKKPNYILQYYREGLIPNFKSNENEFLIPEVSNNGKDEEFETPKMKKSELPKKNEQNPASSAKKAIPSKTTTKTQQKKEKKSVFDIDSHASPEFKPNITKDPEVIPDYEFKPINKEQVRKFFCLIS